MDVHPQYLRNALPPEAFGSSKSRTSCTSDGTMDGTRFHQPLKMSGLCWDMLGMFRKLFLCCTEHLGANKNSRSLQCTSSKHSSLVDSLISCCGSYPLDTHHLRCTVIYRYQKYPKITPHWRSSVILPPSRSANPPSLSICFPKHSILDKPWDILGLSSSCSESAP